MTRENVLFSIIGVLLGFIVGFMFTNSVNQRAAVSRAGESVAAGGGPGGQQLPMNAVKDQKAMQTAVEEAAKQAREEPNNFDAQMKAAELHYQLGRYDETSEFLLRANELRPDDYDVVVTLGNINFDAARYEVAERWYTAALEKKPDDISVRTDLGLTFFLREPSDVDRAIKEFRRSLEFDPRHEQTLHNLVVALTRKGQIAEARETLAKLEQVNPSYKELAKLRAEVEKAGTPPKAAGSDAGGKK